MKLRAHGDSLCWFVPSALRRDCGHIRRGKAGPVICREHRAPREAGASRGKVKRRLAVAQQKNIKGAAAAKRATALNRVRLDHDDCIAFLRRVLVSPALALSDRGTSASVLTALFRVAVFIPGLMPTNRARSCDFKSARRQSWSSASAPVVRTRQHAPDSVPAMGPARSHGDTGVWLDPSRRYQAGVRPVPI